jgi:hypothetical protein
MWPYVRGLGLGDWTNVAAEGCVARKLWKGPVAALNAASSLLVSPRAALALSSAALVVWKVRKTWRKARKSSPVRVAKPLKV